MYFTLLRPALVIVRLLVAHLPQLAGQLAILGRLELPNFELALAQQVVQVIDRLAFLLLIALVPVRRLVVAHALVQQLQLVACLLVLVEQVGDALPFAS